MNIRYPSLFVVALTLSLGACASTQNRGPELASATESLAYASVYAAQLQEMNERFSEGTTFASTVASGFKDYPAELAKTDWDQVTEVYRQADEAGRSVQGAEGIRAHEAIARFVDDSQGDVAWKVGAHVNNAMQKAGCSCDYDARGAAKWALKDATTRELDKQLWSSNEGHRLVEERAEILGKKNVKILHRQVQEISETGFFVFVDLVEMRTEMTRMADEANDVNDTLAEAIKAEQKILDSDASKARKRAAKARSAELEDARTPIEATAAQTRALLDGADDHISNAQRDYRQAFGALLDETEAKSTPR